VPGVPDYEGKMTEVTLELCGFSEQERLMAHIATTMTADLFFPMAITRR
jgi:hypothetical protein